MGMPRGSVKGSPSKSSTNWLRDDGLLRSADDPPVHVAHDPRGGLDLGCGSDLSHDTRALQMPIETKREPNTGCGRKRPRKYPRDRRWTVFWGTAL